MVWIIWMAGITAAGYCGETKFITDTDIKKMFESSEKLQDVHSVMVDQRQRMQTIFDGFVMGDEHLIADSVNGLDSDMQFIGRNAPIDKGKAMEVWQSMSYILQRSKKMKQNIEKKDYQKAFVDFSAMSAHCIQCHEAARGWGRLEPALIETVSFEETPQDAKS